MNYRLIVKNLGVLICIEAACMVPSLVVALIYGDGDASAFIISMVIMLAVGFAMSRFKPKKTDIFTRDGLVMAGFAWVLVAIFGALPFLISGAIPSISDALFESISGFSTTGASILREVESLPKGIVFWRSFTNWIGGMGVLVLMLAIIPSAKGNTVHIMNAESPGPAPEKIAPKVGEVAKILYTIYLALTVIQTVMLLLGGMSLYDALIHSFSAAGTGGFSSRNKSIASFDSLYIEVVLTVFMLLFSLNFGLYFALLKGNWKSVLKDEELRFYLCLVVVATGLITANTFGVNFSTIGEALRHASFQVSSIVTTTGFSTVNFNLWPEFSHLIIMLLMVVGGCASSTAGGLKNVRIVLLAKIAKREINRMVHPRAVASVRLNGKVVEEKTLNSVLVYLFVYLVITIVSILLISLEGYDLTSTVSAVLTALNNVGPALGVAGPASNFADFSNFSKGILSVCMAIGRLEIYPMLLIFLPATWKKV